MFITKGLFIGLCVMAGVFFIACLAIVNMDSEDIKRLEQENDCLMEQIDVLACQNQRLLHHYAKLTSRTDANDIEYKVRNNVG